MPQLNALLESLGAVGGLHGTIGFIRWQKKVSSGEEKQQGESPATRMWSVLGKGGHRYKNMLKRKRDKEVGGSQSELVLEYIFQGLLAVMGRKWQL